MATDGLVGLGCGVKFVVLGILMSTKWLTSAPELLYRVAAARFRAHLYLQRSRAGFRLRMLCFFRITNSRSKN
jgi:hypothetical protein